MPKVTLPIVKRNGWHNNFALQQKRSHLQYSNGCHAQLAMVEPDKRSYLQAVQNTG